MTGKRVGDFEIIDVYDLKQEEFEKFRDEHDDFEYWQEGETVYTAEEYREELFGDLERGQEFTVSKYFGCDENIVIPDVATQLSSGLFEDNEKIKNVIIPDGVKVIESSAFRNCTALEKVVFGKNVADIWAFAFCGCSALKEIEIPSGITNIRRGVFAKCAALKEVTIPDGVKALSEDAFADCFSLSCVHLGSGLKRIYSGAFARDKSLKKITLPLSLESVDMHAFSESGIEELYIPKNVSDVGQCPFTSCGNLKKIEVDTENPHLICKDNCIVRKSIGMLLATVGNFKLPNDGSIKKIWHWMFCGNRDLTEMDIPEGVTHLYHSVFAGCKNLRRVSLPNTLENIGEKDFEGCDALEEIVIPGSVKEVESWAFSCSGIKKLVIKRGVKILGFNAFNGCKSLTEAYIPSSVYKIDCGLLSGELFRDCNENLCVYMEKHENGVHEYLTRFLGKVKVKFIDKGPMFD